MNSINFLFHLLNLHFKSLSNIFLTFSLELDHCGKAEGEKICVKIETTPKKRALQLQQCVVSHVYWRILFVTVVRIKEILIAIRKWYTRRKKWQWLKIKYLLVLGIYVQKGYLCWEQCSIRFLVNGFVNLFDDIWLSFEQKCIFSLYCWQDIS